MSQLHKSTAGREQMIAEAAYFRAERRGFEGGDPLTDWLEAEAEITARLVPPEARADGASAGKRRSHKKASTPKATTRRRRN